MAQPLCLLIALIQQTVKEYSILFFKMNRRLLIFTVA